MSEMPATSSALSERPAMFPRLNATGNITASAAITRRPPEICSVSPITECDSPSRWPISCTAIDSTSKTFDNTPVKGPADLRDWLSSKYADQFVTVATEKLLTYALGRGVEYQDMPLVRQLSRDAVKSDSRFSALVLGVVKSRPFQMNTRAESSAAGKVAAARSTSNDKGNH